MDMARRLARVAVAAALALGPLAAAPAVALADAQDGAPNGDAAITLRLNAALGIDTSNSVFTFTFIPRAGTGTTAEEAKKPVDENKFFTTISTGDNATSRDYYLKFLPESAASFPHTGVYSYEVTQTSAKKDDAEISVDFTRDTQAYEVNVSVVNGTNGLAYGNVTAKKKDGPKVDPAVPTGATNKSGLIPSSATVNGLLFTNVYSKTSQLKLSLAVAGDYANKDTEFAPSITFTLPEGYAAGESITVKVRGTDKTYTVTGRSFTVPINDLKPTDTDRTGLRGGDSATVSQLPVGTTYSVTQPATPNFKAGATFAYAGASGDPVSNAVDEQSENTALTVSATGDDITHTTTIGPGEGNAVTITNTSAIAAPTGLRLADLPWVAAVALAAAGVVALTVAGARRDARGE